MVRNKRILFLSSLLKGYDTALDMGSDHGYVLEEAFKKGYIKKGITSDVREMPLQQSLKTLKNYPVQGILSDGFLAINESFDACVIAGMGAYLISDIMTHAPLHDAIYILQPNDKYGHLRKRLEGLNFKIVDEYIVYDKFYYIIMKVERGVMHLTEEDLILGPYLKDKQEALPYYQKRLNMIEQIMNQADDLRKNELQQEYHVLYQKLKKKD
jgi:tRNA (adenine22-N1)-methyltransferase